MKTDNEIFITAVAAANPFGETDASKHKPITSEITSPDLKPLIRELCGKPLRQASNLVELGVIGAQTLKLRLGDRLLPGTRLYVATGMGDITKNLKLFQQVSPPANGLAAPFDFINSSANTTAFYVAKLLGLNARNLTVSRDEFSFETALQIAISDIRSGDSQSALVGGIDEIPNIACRDFTQMAKKNSLIPGQGSGWVFLNNTRETALGKISQVIKINSNSSMSIDDWSKGIFESLGEHLDKTIPLKLMPGYGITQAECSGIAKNFVDCNQENYIQYCGAYYTASAFGLARLFEFEHEIETQYLHIMRNELGETMCVLLSVYPRRT